MMKVEKGLARQAEDNLTHIINEVLISNSDTCAKSTAEEKIEELQKLLNEDIERIEEAIQQLKSILIEIDKEENTKKDLLRINDILKTLNYYYGEIAILESYNAYLNS